jgi:hypothetical protein
MVKDADGIPCNPGGLLFKVGGRIGASYQKLTETNGDPLLWKFKCVAQKDLHCYVFGK